MSVLLCFLCVLPAFIFTPDRLKTIAAARERKESRVPNCPLTACRNREGQQKPKNRPARDNAAARGQVTQPSLGESPHLLL